MIKNRKKIRSIISYIPIIKNILRKKGTSPLDGEYYYHIYQKHKNKLSSIGINFPLRTLGEIGPGDTLGIGICALFDGFEKYFALDVIPHADMTKNINVLKELVKYFPNHQEKYNRIENELKKLDSKTDQSGLLLYIAPWNELNKIMYNSIDVIISNAVMEHVLEVDNIYKRLYSWLKPGGLMSHIIDYGAHEFSDLWYEHFYLSEFYWKFLMHGRMYPINRYPHSYHVKKIKDAGFEIMLDEKKYEKPAIKEKIDVSIREFFSDEDISIPSAHIIAKKI